MLFPVSRAATLAKLEPKVVRSWIAKGLVRPAHRAVGLLSFRDLVALRTLAILHRDHGVRIGGRKGLARFSAWLLAQRPDAWSTLRFYVAGREVLFDDAGALVSSYPAGQTTSRPVQELDMRTVEASARHDVEALAKRRHGRIDRKKRVVEGTRIPTATIRRLNDAGMSPRSIAAEFPSLTVADVNAALSFEHGRAA